jgi:hypothetical protein
VHSFWYGVPHLGSTNVPSRVLAHLARKNEILDKLAKLGSNQAMVPTGVFLQELHESSI